MGVFLRESNLYLKLTVICVSTIDFSVCYRSATRGYKGLMYIKSVGLKDQIYNVNQNLTN